MGSKPTFTSSRKPSWLNLRLQDPDVYNTVLYPHVLDLNEDIACPFVLLADPLEVVPEEDTVENRSGTRKDNLHEFVGCKDRVAGKADVPHDGVLLDPELDEDPAELLDHADIDVGEEAETVDRVNILLDLFGIELVPGLCADHTEDMFGDNLLVAGDVDADDNRMNGRK
ncbi:MAG: hypothetical protein XE01_1419 [Synergistales bacterium 58_81]|nr:MAG: hypothetical protein XE01_1419 [Synergistales bacterium 58_81]